MATAEKTVGKVSFWTEGEGFTRLMLDFWAEGQYKKVFLILKDGQLPMDAIRTFFELRGSFEGDSRTEEGLSYLIADEQPADFDEQMYWSLANCVKSFGKSYIEYDEVTENEVFNEDFLLDNPQLEILSSVMSKEMLDKAIANYILRQKYKYIEDSGFEINPSPMERHSDGAVLANGDYIVCGFQEHRYLYPVLKQLGFSDSGDWTHDEKTIHVSSGSMSGTLAYAFENCDDKMQPTQEQLDTLFKYRGSIKGFYGYRDDSTTKSLLEFHAFIENFGGKYNNLSFLTKRYPELNLPKFSKTDLGIENQCIRTSPKRSLPGLLNSKFNINENSIKEIEQDFERFKDLRPDNELHYFYQEFIAGDNGVCHYQGKGEFTYQVSENQGDVVSGKAVGKMLELETYQKLRNLARMLFEDIQEPVQLEFVVNAEGEIYIVQLRLLENNYEKTVQHGTPQGFIQAGFTFSKGDVECNLDEVLIVEEDANSEDLIGKKALIVKSNVEFSHILALSKALRIPSIFGTGELAELPEKIHIKAINREGYICKV